MAPKDPDKFSAFRGPQLNGVLLCSDKGMGTVRRRQLVARSPLDFSEDFRSGWHRRLLHDEVAVASIPQLPSPVGTSAYRSGYSRQFERGESPPRFRFPQPHGSSIKSGKDAVTAGTQVNLGHVRGLARE
jgi:hypothetical protein